MCATRAGSKTTTAKDECASKSTQYTLRACLTGHTRLGYMKPTQTAPKAWLCQVYPSTLLSGFEKGAYVGSCAVNQRYGRLADVDDTPVRALILFAKSMRARAYEVRSSTAGSRCVTSRQHAPYFSSTQSSAAIFPSQSCSMENTFVCKAHTEPSFKRKPEHGNQHGLRRCHEGEELWKPHSLNSRYAW